MSKRQQGKALRQTSYERTSLRITHASTPVPFVRLRCIWRRDEQLLDDLCGTGGQARRSARSGERIVPNAQRLARFTAIDRGGMH